MLSKDRALEVEVTKSGTKGIEVTKGVANELRWG